MGGVIAAGLLTGWAIAVPIGAVGALLVTISARHRFGVAAAAGLGVATVDGSYAALAVLAGSTLSRWLEPIATALRIGSAVVLLAVAVLIALGALRASTDEAATRRTPSPGRTYVSFVALTAVNPATVVYFTAIVLGNQHLTETAVQSVTFVAAVFAASASWCLTLATAGTLLGRGITGPTGRRVTGLVSAVVVAGLAVRTMAG